MILDARALDTPAWSDRMVEFTGRVISDERGTMSAECDGERLAVDARLECGSRS